MNPTDGTILQDISRNNFYDTDEKRLRTLIRYYTQFMTESKDILSDRKINIEVTREADSADGSQNFIVKLTPVEAPLNIRYRSMTNWYLIENWLSVTRFTEDVEKVKHPTLKIFLNI